MKHFVLKLSMALTLGAGLAIVLLWSLGRRSTELPIAHAGELRVCKSGCLYSSIQAAVDAANSGDIVKVAAGTYTGVSARAGVTQVVYISETITIQGGYTTTNWTAPYPITQPTTLDAQGQGGVMYITGNVNPTVEGLHITGGASFFDFDQDLYLGGGIYVVSATPTISGNWVFSNTLGIGGGLFLWHSKATVRGNRVYSNTSGLGGGLMLSDSDATLSGNWVFGNISSLRGGGVALVRSAAVVIGNSIISNSASDRGGGIYVLGSAAMINNNTVVSNSANPGSMGVGGGVYLGSSLATVSGNLIAYNSAYQGGGVSAGVSTTLSGNLIRFNTATYRGGGMSLGGGFSGDRLAPPVLVGNTIVSNTAPSGAGLFLNLSDATLINNVVADNHATANGSGLYVGWSSPRLTHNTIARNTGGDGSGILVASFASGSAVTLTNTILVSHTVGITVLAGDTATLQGTLWGTGAWANDADWGGAGTILTGTINVFDDPAFVNPDTGDYHIGSTSAAINAAVNAGVNTDIDNQPRPYQTPDLGADEYWPPGTLKYVYLPIVLRQLP